MSPRGEPPASWGSADAADVRAEALNAVSDAQQWQLAQPRWHAVEQAVAEMEAAVAAGDLDALEAATADLELIGPLRITRIGATPVVPPAPVIRSRLEKLEHSLRDTPPAGPSEDDKRERR